LCGTVLIREALAYVIDSDDLIPPPGTGRDLDEIGLDDEEPRSDVGQRGQQ
jgi:hypothetical protein